MNISEYFKIFSVYILRKLPIQHMDIRTCLIHKSKHNTELCPFACDLTVGSQTLKHNKHRVSL